MNRKETQQLCDGFEKSQAEIQEAILEAATAPSLFLSRG